MTYPEIAEALRNAGIEEAEYEARLLIARYCHRSMAEILSSRQADYAESGLLDAVRERQTRRPLQYIFGEWPFWHETYRVREGCLIPRPDTETLVAAAVSRLSARTVFWDLCSGSGCVGISVLASRKDLKCVSADIEPVALELTAENAKRNGVEKRIFVTSLDVMQGDFSEIPDAYARPSAILSNPPYIPSGEIDGLSEEVCKEPRVALDGGPDGLRFYRRLIETGAKKLGPDGKMLMEIGAGQAPALLRLAESFGFRASFEKDLSGIERVVILTRA